MTRLYAHALDNNSMNTTVYHNIFSLRQTLLLKQNKSVSYKTLRFP